MQNELDPAPVTEIESLIERYSVEEEIFEVVAPLGDVFKFRSLPRYGDLKSFRNAMVDWVSTLPLAGSPGSQSHMWKEHLPKTSAEAIAAYTISTLSVEPKFSHLDALKLLQAATLVQHLLEQIERKSKTMESLWLSRLIEDAKKNCEATTGDEQDSP